jgi:hypothetical protein
VKSKFDYKKINLKDDTSKDKPNHIFRSKIYSEGLKCKTKINNGFNLTYYKNNKEKILKRIKEFTTRELEGLKMFK